MSIQFDTATGAMIQSEQIVLADNTVTEVIEVSSTEHLIMQAHALELVPESTPAVYGVQAWANANAARC